MDSYLVLLRVGFTIAAPVTSRAVRSYRTISPLPHGLETKSREAVYFLLHFPWAHTPQALPGTLPYGARTFLPPTIAGKRSPDRLGGKPTSPCRLTQSPFIDSR